MLVINIFGVPGTQKSKFLSSTYSTLACNDVDCGVIGDINVDLNKNTFSILGSILDRIESEKHKDVIVTNTPILLQTVYYRQNDLPSPDMFEIIAYKMYQKYSNLNILIEDPNNTYVYRDIKDMFTKYDIPYELVTNIQDTNYAIILSTIVDRLKGDWN